MVHALVHSHAADDDSGAGLGRDFHRGRQSADAFGAGVGCDQSGESDECGGRQ